MTYCVKEMHVRVKFHPIFLSFQIAKNYISYFKVKLKKTSSLTWGYLDPN